VGEWLSDAQSGASAGESRPRGTAIAEREAPSPPINGGNNTERNGNERNQMNVFKNLLKDEQGASMAEYALLLALIAVATIGALQVLSGQIVGVFEASGDAIDAALPAS
jgi:Flp pilus assembly pilin Flp